MITLLRHKPKSTLMTSFANSLRKPLTERQVTEIFVSWADDSRDKLQSEISTPKWGSPASNPIQFVVVSLTYMGLWVCFLRRSSQGGSWVNCIVLSPKPSSESSKPPQQGVRAHLHQAQSRSERLSRRLRQLFKLTFSRA